MEMLPKSLSKQKRNNRESLVRCIYRHVCIGDEVLWRGARLIGVEGRRYKTRGVGVLVEEGLCEKEVEVRRSDRVMPIVIF